MIPVEDILEQLRHNVRAIIPAKGKPITFTEGELIIILDGLNSEVKELTEWIKENCGCDACLHWQGKAGEKSCRANLFETGERWEFNRM